MEEGWQCHPGVGDGEEWGTGRIGLERKDIKVGMAIAAR